MYPKLKATIKYLFVVAILVVIGISILSPILISHYENNWKKKSEEITNRIESESKDIILQEKIGLEKALSSIEDYLISHNSLKSPNQNDFLNFVKTQFPDLSVIVVDSSGELIFWSNYINNFAPNYYDNIPGEIFFFDSGMKKFLGIHSNTTLLNNNLSLNILTAIDKEYKLPLEENSGGFLEEELNKKFGVKFILDSYKNASVLDSNFHSYNILNRDGKEILRVSFPKPREKVYLNKLTNLLFTIKAVSFTLGLLFLFMLSLPNILKIKSHYIRLLIYLITLVSFRILIYLLGLPDRIFHTNLSNPEYFSSQFAFGIVKSPLEFLITGIFAVIISIIVFGFVNKYYKNKNLLKSSKFFYLVAISIIGLTLLLIRSVGAMSKSVIRDSTINYFSDYNLISKLPAVLMQINTLLAGFAIFIIIISGFVFLFTNHNGDKTKKKFLLTFISTEIFGVLYHYLQPYPQVSIPIVVIVIAFIYFVTYLIVEKHISIPKALFYTAFVASFSTAILLNYYNSEQEKESLKNIAHDLSQSKRNYYEYLIDQTLNSKEIRNIAINGIKSKQVNGADISAFKIWINSNLKSETAKMEIVIFDSLAHPIGRFNLGYKTKKEKFKNFKFNDYPSPIIKEEKLSDKNEVLLSGNIPLFDKNKLFGFLTVNIVDEVGIVKNNLPEFLTPTKPFVNSAINDRKLNIYELQDAKLSKQNSDINLSSENIRQILNAHYNQFNETWTEIKRGENDLILYAYKTDTSGYSKTFIVGIKEKGIAFGLFHFFKVLFVHSILIVVLLLIYFVFFEKNRNRIIRSFNSKLFASFLIISIVPLILMAISIKELTEDKNDSAVYYKLEKRAKNIENYLLSHGLNGNTNTTKFYDNISNDLNINYSLFDNKKLIYSSFMQYYNVGLFPDVLNSDVYYEQKNMGLTIYIDKTKIAGKSFTSLYYRTNISGKDLVIEISDAINPILLPMSGTELDIFLFGSYSFAIILIIIFSTILARQISSPIRQLTAAAKSVAGGNLNLEVVQKEKGEVKDLVNEFNYMVKELKKSQAALSEIERETAWKEMAKQVAHEVKNPLTPMKLSVQQLVIAYKEKSPKFDKIFTTVTGTIIKQIEILKNIASEFSNFARMPILKVEQVDLTNILIDVQNLFSDESADIIIIGNKEKLFIKADADQLKRTIVNLIRNSLQANADKIKMEVTEVANSAVIRIIDNGHGIHQEKLNKVFDVEFTTKEKGMGLGLSIAKKFIESIGGDIKIESTPPQGTVIIIKLLKF